MYCPKCKRVDYPEECEQAYTIQNVGECITCWHIEGGNSLERKDGTKVYEPNN